MFDNCEISRSICPAFKIALCGGLSLGYPNLCSPAIVRQTYGKAAALRFIFGHQIRSLGIIAAPR